MKIKNLFAAACALFLAVPLHAYTVDDHTECFFWNKKEETTETEETVLDESITPRRGNGPDSYDQRSPRREEQRPPHPEKPKHPKRPKESVPSESESSGEETAESGPAVTTAAGNTA